MVSMYEQLSRYIVPCYGAKSGAPMISSQLLRYMVWGVGLHFLGAIVYSINVLLPKYTASLLGAITGSRRYPQEYSIGVMVP